MTLRHVQKERTEKVEKHGSCGLGQLEQRPETKHRCRCSWGPHSVGIASIHAKVSRGKKTRRKNLSRCRDEPEHQHRLGKLQIAFSFRGELEVVVVQSVRSPTLISFCKDFLLK